MIKEVVRQVKSVRTGVANAEERSGIGHVRMRDLRHSTAVMLLSAGIPIEKVAQVLGHSNISVTYSAYGRYLPEHLQDAVIVLDFPSISEMK
ncbi:tyrosine-type recombinase/integrase [Pseudooceanicola antarcticus]|uniref:tyrosine-type recombinase/integrase n=1 Tax=Pseudooceanicola antarcticus TaxID=1247613 RepID=UPI001E4E179A|nr:tyrosine-type recombinase/integrase [Pseudooceanicola antarcticus]